MKKWILIFSLFLIVSFPKPHYAQIISAASGNWNSSSTWQGGVIPGTSDAVVITVGHTITITSDAQCSILSFSTTNSQASSGFIQVNSGCTLTVTNAISVPLPAATVKNNDTYTLRGDGVINCGSLDIGNIIAPGGNNSTTLTLFTTVRFLNISGNVNLYSSFTSQGNKANHPFLDIQAGTATIGGTISTVNANAICTSKISTRNGLASGTVILAGTNPFNVSVIGTSIFEFDGTNATFDYAYSGPQIILPTKYRNLKLSGTGEKTTSGVTVDGSLSVVGGAVLTSQPTFSTPPDIEYTGDSPLITGNELPTSVTVIRVNNSAGVTLNKIVSATKVFIGDKIPNSILNDGGYRITTNELHLVSGMLNLSVPGSAPFPVHTVLNVAPGFTVKYSANDIQTVSSVMTYDKLILGGTGLKTTHGVTVNELLVMEGGAVASNMLSYGENVTIEYSGTSNQNTGAELPAIISELRINNSGGTVFLGSDVTISSALQFLQGKLRHSHGNKLTLSSNAVVIGESAGKYLVGKVERSENLGVNASSASINSLGLSIDAGTDMGQVTITRITGETFLSGANSIKRYWIISPQFQPSIIGRTLTLTWLPDDDNSIDLTKAVVYKSTDAGLTWLPVTDVNGTDVSGGRQFILPNVESFSIWTIGDASGPLPVELTYFAASQVHDGIMLNWETATEVNNYGFDVERGTTLHHGIDWKRIGFVQGNGNSNSSKQYSFVDSSPGSGKILYRLKQFDVAGTYEYSEHAEVNLEVPDIYLLEQNFPNPFNATTMIRFKLPHDTELELSIYDVLGAEVATLLSGYFTAGFHSISFNSESYSLAGGVYFYRLRAGSQTMFKKLVLMK